MAIQNQIHTYHHHNTFVATAEICVCLLPHIYSNSLMYFTHTHTHPSNLLCAFHRHRKHTHMHKDTHKPTAALNKT